MHIHHEAVVARNYICLNSWRQLLIRYYDDSPRSRVFQSTIDFFGYLQTAYKAFFPHQSWIELQWPSAAKWIFESSPAALSLTAIVIQMDCTLHLVIHCHLWSGAISVHYHYNASLIHFIWLIHHHLHKRIGVSNKFPRLSH